MTVRLALAVLCALAVAPASAGASVVTYGSDLTAPANVSEDEQADTIYWQSAFPDARQVLAPATGQVKSVRIKGIARSNPVPGVPGGETDFHVQILTLLPDGTWQIRNPGGTSGNFNLPPLGADPQTVSEYVPENLCVYQGDAVVFSTVGGWDNSANGPYAGGTPLQIFSRVPNAVTSYYMKADATNNGDIVRFVPVAEHELLMQVTSSRCATKRPAAASGACCPTATRSRSSCSRAICPAGLPARPARAAEQAAEEALRPPQGIDRAVRLLAAEHGIPAHAHGEATVVIDEPLGGLPESTMILALRLADETGPVFARGVTEEGRPVLAAWCAPWLAVEKVGKTGLRHGGAWRVGARQTLHVIDRADIPRADLRWPAGSERPRDVLDLLVFAEDDD